MIDEYRYRQTRSMHWRGLFSSVHGWVLFLIALLTLTQLILKAMGK
jgi:hypothetical protein